MKQFQQIQHAFNEYLRAPDIAAVDVSRRQEIYRELVFKNISRLIAESLPIIRNIISDEDWHFLIRNFIADHPAKTPYFLEVCQEFLVYLNGGVELPKSVYPFAFELAHFEWVKLALSIADVEFSEHQNSGVPTETSIWKASPLLMGLSYSYPVHLIDECYLPAGQEPSYLLVYRDSEDEVQVLQVEKFTLRLVQLLQECEGINYVQLAILISKEIDSLSEDAIVSKVRSELITMAENNILFYEK